MLTTFQTREGRTLSYLRRGSGPLVVCIPGGPGMDPEAYFAAMNLPGYEMLVLAPRGTGESSPPVSPEGYRIAGYVEDVEALREHLGVETLTLYGNSHGGVVALAYAETHPRRVARFVVTNAPARMDEPYREAAAETKRRFAQRFPDGAERLAAAERADAELESGDLDEADRRTAFRTVMAQYVATQGPVETAYLDRLCSAPMQWESVEVMYAEMLEGLDLLTPAADVTAPALVIAGEFDVVVPAAAMRRLADALPDASYAELTGAGHFVEVEASARFQTAVCEFLAEGERSSGSDAA